MDKKTYIFAADVTRDIAIIGVVIIHTINAVYTRPDFFGGITWWITTFLDSASRISIPLFIMLSGYLLLKKDETMEQSLKRIASRIIVPFIFWVLFYFWYGGGLPSFNFIRVSILKNVFQSNVFHLYYLVILMGLYVIAPLIRAYLRSVSFASQEFLMKIFLVGGVLQVGLEFIFQTCAAENFFTRWMPYTGFFIAGYVLGTKQHLLKTSKLFIWYAAAFTTTVGLNYLHYFLVKYKYNFLDAPGCLSYYSDHYLSINVVIMSLCAFIFLLHASYGFLQNNRIAAKIIASLARTSFGIYLAHPFINRFLEMQFHLAVDISKLPIFIIITLKFFLVFVLSYFLTFFCLKIPIVQLVFGGKR
ncbi:MAG: acyltransferase family protein [Candidatus Levyibacteriota bacterium]|nr:MAG: acyltransferase family protein [Candidatus Levybacteria bacterium]